MSVSQAVFTGAAGATVDATASGKVTEINGSFTYGTAAPLGQWINSATGLSSAHVRNELATPDRVVLHGAWLKVSALPNADFRLLEGDTSGDALAAMMLLNSLNYARLTTRGSSVRATNTNVVFPINTPIWCSILVDAGSSTTTGKAQAAYYTEAGGNTPAWNSTLFENINTADAVGLISRIRAGKYGGGAYAGSVSIAAPTWKTGSDAVWPLLPQYATNAPPTGTITTPATAVQNSQVDLRGTAQDTDGTIASTVWSITAWPATLSGPPVITNGNTLNGGSFVAVAPGTYTLSLTITDNSGAVSAPITKNVVVSAAGGSGTTYTNRKFWNGSAFAYLANQSGPAAFGSAVYGP